MNNNDTSNEQFSMSDEQQQFFKLLKYSNELKQNNDHLETKDFESFKILLTFLARIEHNLHYSEKDEYLDLIKDFLTDKITADDFTYSFMAIYEGVTRICRKMQREESPELASFLKPCRSELGKLISKIYGSCDSFSPDPTINMSDEKELKNYARILALELQYEQ